MRTTRKAALSVMLDHLRTTLLTVEQYDEAISFLAVTCLELLDEIVPDDDDDVITRPRVTGRTRH